jgi:hypothetical protein
MLIAVAVLGVGTGMFARYRCSWYYALGWWDAERELWRGYVIIDRISGLRFGDMCLIDADTGLPVSGGAGCVSHVGDDERRKGHNDHVAQYIRWHGLPKNTLKPWEKELFNLKRDFDERSRRVSPARLLPDGPAVLSPSGRNSVRLVEGVKGAQSPDCFRQAVIAAGNVVLHNWFAHFEKGDSDVLWGPEGSPFVVIRSVSENKEHYVAYDLRTGRHLRDETWEAGEYIGERNLKNALARLKMER